MTLLTFRIIPNNSSLRELLKKIGSLDDKNPKVIHIFYDFNPLTTDPILLGGVVRGLRPIRPQDVVNENVDGEQGGTSSRGYKE